MARAYHRRARRVLQANLRAAGVLVCPCRRPWLTRNYRGELVLRALVVFLVGPNGASSRKSQLDDVGAFLHYPSPLGVLQLKARELQPHSSRALSSCF